VANQPDIDAARRLVDDLSHKLAQLEGGPRLDELRAEVESLRGVLAGGQTQVLGTRVKGVNSALRRAGVEIEADGMKLGALLSELGRILGLD
jgi:hypothetical protein